MKIRQDCGLKIAIVDQYNIREVIESINLNTIDGFQINKKDGNLFDDICSAIEVNRLKALVLFSSWQNEYPDVFSKMVNLELLSHEFDKMEFSKEMFPLLKHYLGVWPNVLLKSFQNLTTLRVRSGKHGKEFPINEIYMPILENLSLSHFRMEKLPKFHSPNLRDLELSFMTKLCCINDFFELNTIRKISLFSCKKLIVDLSNISLGKNLVSIEMTSLGGIVSLDFLDSSTELRYLSFYKTPILDEDLKPLLRSKLTNYTGKLGPQM
jgi:hypothetical protein